MGEVGEGKLYWSSNGGLIFLLSPPLQCPPPPNASLFWTKMLCFSLKQERFGGLSRWGFGGRLPSVVLALLSWMSVATKPISLCLAFTCLKVSLVSSNTLQVIPPECQRKVRQSGVLKTSRTKTCPTSSTLTGSISSAGTGSQQQLPGEHFQANALSDYQ